jgi:2-polyprenyl-3-methyl-5-hydroxy-6-metoxy-1,4-benzoquinol methylase
MTLYPLDAARNALPAQNLEPPLEVIRDRIIAGSFPSDEVASHEDLLRAFDIARARLNVIASHLRNLPGSRGAEIGTGLGFLPPLLELLGLQVTATAKDPDEAGFLIGQNIPLVKYELEQQPPFSAASLDWIVFSEVLEHLKMPPVRALRVLSGLLRPGGRLILTTPNIARLSHLEALAAGDTFLEAFSEDIPPFADPTDYLDHVREYSMREVVEAVEAANLSIDVIEMTGWGESGYHPLPNPFANEIIVVTATRYDPGNL